MITFHTFPGTKELESFSPFCMKVEVYMKAQGLEYKTAAGADPRKAPKKKMPFIEDDGTIVCDSSAILAFLEKKSKTPMDAGLDAEARARAHVLQRTFEESLYWVVLWSRWVDDDGWTLTGPRIASQMPAAVRWFMPGLIRKQVKGAAFAQGYGRHSPEEIYALGAADLEAIATLLGDKPFFLGDTPRMIDVIAYAFLANIHYWDKPSPVSASMKKLPTLEAFVMRARERFKAGSAAAAAE